MKQLLAAYDPVTKVLHWTVAAAILIMFLTAFAMGAPDGFLSLDMRKAVYTTHKTTGFFILLLMVFRVFWGHFHPAPPLPLNRFPRWQVFVARFVHDALYALTIITPFIGWALVSTSSYELKLFGVLSIPSVSYMDFFKGSEDMSTFLAELHETLAIILVCLLIVHIGATFLHHFVDRDEILLRITPTAMHPWLERIRGQ